MEQASLELQFAFLITGLYGSPEVVIVAGLAESECRHRHSHPFRSEKELQIFLKDIVKEYIKTNEEA
jgi:hypothetical protein